MVESKKEVQKRNKDASSALRRVDALVEDWLAHSTEKVESGQYVMWSSNEIDLDVRDLQLLLAVAMDERDFLVRAEAAVKGWTAANERQIEIINRLRKWQSRALQILKDKEMTDTEKIQNMKVMEI